MKSALAPPNYRGIKGFTHGGQANSFNEENTMPKKLENKLKKLAKKKGLTKERFGAYVYGTMNKIEKKKK